MAVDGPRTVGDPDPFPAAMRAVLGRFPLVARPRLTCGPIDARLREISELAEAARTGCADPASATAIAYNKASLIASDCGIPDLARDLCHRHHEIHRSVRPWTARHARFALEPLVNLARLAYPGQASRTSRSPNWSTSTTPSARATGSSSRADHPD